jgi:hypothetical protein
MIEKPPHVRQLFLNHERKIGLKNQYIHDAEEGIGKSPCFKIKTKDWRLQEEMERQRTEAKRMLDGLTMVEDKVQDKQEDNNKGRRPSRFHSTNIY